MALTWVPSRKSSVIPKALGAQLYAALKAMSFCIVLATRPDSGISCSRGEVAASGS